jgi:hypothetical protein
MTRIILEDYDLDIDAELSNQITYAIDDLNNLDSKSTSFSKTIVIPGTTKNNGLLGNIFEFNNSNVTIDSLPNVKYNFNASKTAKCRIEVNGLQIIKGVFRLLEIVYNGNQVEYECAVFGELGGFVSKLGNLRIEDLDFSAYNHTYDVSGITGSWANANAGAGYIYPHIDYGTYSTNKKDWKYGTFRPAFFVKEYFEKILNNSGYTYDFPLLLTDRFKRLIIPHNQKILSRLTSSFISGSATDFLLLYGDGVNPPVDQSTIPVTSVSVSANFTTLSTSTWKYIGASSVNVNISLVVSGTSNNSSGTYFYIGFKDGSTNDYTPTQFYAYDTIFSTSNSDIPFSATINKTMVLNTNDIVTLYACSADGPVGTGDVYNVNLTVDSFTINSTIPTLVPAVLGDSLTVNDSIPKNIFQKDFFTSLLKLFNLYVYEDKFIEKHLIIKPFVDFYDTTLSSYLDWSSKIDRSKQIRSKPMSEVNARYYNFKFKPDSDFFNEQYKKRYNEGYGDRIYDNGLDFSKETSSIELVFAATPLVGYGSEDKVYSTIFKSSNSVEENIDSVIRILQANQITGVASWTILNGASVIATRTDYCYAGHFNDPDVPSNDLNFGIPKELFFVLVTGDVSVNQFNVYYSAYMAEITDKDSRLLTVMVKLTEQDVFDLDFSKFIYIDGGLYRLSKLIDYTAGANDTTKAELLRVIYTTY